MHLVGDVMRDLAARTLTEVRKASALVGIAGGGLRTGEFLFATVHRAENRAPDAIRGWVGLLDSAIRAMVVSAPRKLLTPMVLLIGLLSNHAADSGIVVLPPLAAMAGPALVTAVRMAR